MKYIIIIIMNRFVLYFIYLYSALVEFFNNIINEANKNVYVNKCVRTLSGLLEHYNRNMNELVVETDPPFFNISNLNDSNDIEEVNYLLSTEDNEKLGTRLLSLFNNSVDKLRKGNVNNNISKYLITIKYIYDDILYTQSRIIYNNNQSYVYFNLKTIDEHLNSELNLKSKILSIEYSHPDMNNSLEIQLDNSYYDYGNEILDSIFIKKYLSMTYNKNSYVFDNNYKIILIDGDVNILEFGNDSFIRLGGKIKVEKLI